MKLAFLTMVWRDYWLLEKWVAHNSQFVPKRQLYVINHGGDPRVDEIAVGCSILHLPRDEVKIDLDHARWSLLGHITNGLLTFYDRVICNDVDELLVYVGNKGGLLEHLETTPAEHAAIAPVGLNLMPVPSDETDVQATVLQRYPNALLSARYSKPCIVSQPVGYTVGGHGLIDAQFSIDPHIVLFHLHYVTPDYADRMAARKDIVLQSKDHNAAQENPREMPKGFWVNWEKPTRILNKELAAFEQAREEDVSDGLNRCAALLTDAIMHRGRRMIIEPKALGADGPIRVQVPEACTAPLFAISHLP